jgi:hypothetical protein
LAKTAEYAVTLPQKVGNTEPWQDAAKALYRAAGHGGPFVFMASHQLLSGSKATNSASNR